MRVAAAFAVLVLPIVTAGCASTPLAPTPVLPAPAAWQTRTGSGEAMTGNFWAGFGNPTLTALLQQAAEANPDVQIAAQRLRLAADAEQAAAAMKGPTVRFDAGAVDTAAVAVRDQRRRNPAIYRLGLNASYELDFWGRISSLVASARAQSAAQGFDLDTARITLATAVAQQFFDVAEADEQLAVLQNRIALADEALKLQAARQTAGRIDPQPVMAAQQTRDALLAEQRDLLRQRQQHAGQLALLCGQLPEGFRIGSQSLRSSGSWPEVPAGLPSSLLQRRPDIRAAAARLQAAQAEIGVARAEQFPQIRLTAELGVASDVLHRALSGSVGLFGIGPEISLPIYDVGARAARLDASQREADIALLEYRKAGLAAFADVESALLAREAALDRQQQLDATASQQTIESQRLNALLQAGRKSRVDTIVADDARLASHALRIRNDRAQLDALLALHAALGGGWDPSQTVSTPSTLLTENTHAQLSRP